MSNDLKAYNIFDLRDQAQNRIPKGLFEFVDRGSASRVALAAARGASSQSRCGGVRIEGVTE